MFSDDGGFFSYFLISSFLGPLLVVGLIVLGVVAISKGDFDPSGRRAYAFYLYAVCFVALFTLVYSASATVASISRFVGDDTESNIDLDESFDGSSGSDFSSSGTSDTSNLEDLLYDENISPATRQRLLDQIRASRSPGTTEEIESDVRARISDERDDRILREAVQVGVFGLIALGLFAFHWRRARKLVDEPGFAGSPAWRVFNAYLYAVCFVAVVIVLIAGAIAAYAGFRIVFPEITESFDAVDRIEREAGFRALASSGVLVAIAALLALIHWRQIDRPAVVGSASGGPPVAYAPTSATGGQPPPAPPQYPPDSSYRRPDPPGL